MHNHSLLAVHGGCYKDQQEIRVTNGCYGDANKGVFSFIALSLLHPLDHHHDAYHPLSPPSQGSPFFNQSKLRYIPASYMWLSILTLFVIGLVCPLSLVFSVPAVVMSRKVGY